MFERLTVLGAGTVVPLPDYGCAGYLLHWKDAVEGSEQLGGGPQAKGRPILIDCGSGTLDRLCENGTPVEQIELILISHFHVDHVSDLAAVLLSRWIRNLGRQGDVHRVTIAGPIGLADYIAGVSALNQPWISDYRFDLVELAAGAHSFSAPFDGLSIETELTGHTGNSICYRLRDERGHVLFYSGDTDYNEALLPLAAEADLAVVECSMPDTKKIDGHLTPHLAGRFAARARVARLLLTHFYAEVLSVDIKHEVAQEYAGPIELAKKLKSYPIESP